MAMKLDDMGKYVDNVLRQYNSQISKAVKQLGEKHTVTTNLISKATDIYGKENIRYTKDGIPQIARNRATIKQYTKATTLKSETQYIRGAKNGQYKYVYDVSKAYQRAVNQVRQKARNNIPQDLLQYTPEKIPKSYKPQGATDRIPITDSNRQQYILYERSRKINDYINRQTNKTNVDRMLKLNELISEIYEKYADDDTQNINLNELEKFTKDFHDVNETASLSELEKFVNARYDRIFNVVDGDNKNKRDETGGMTLENAGL